MLLRVLRAAEAALVVDTLRANGRGWLTARVAGPSMRLVACNDTNLVVEDGTDRSQWTDDEGGRRAKVILIGETTSSGRDCRLDHSAHPKATLVTRRELAEVTTALKPRTSQQCIEMLQFGTDAGRDVQPVGGRARGLDANQQTVDLRVVALERQAFSQVRRHRGFAAPRTADLADPERTLANHLGYSLCEG